MKNIKQAGILFIMLIVPVLIYAFFKIFGSHEFLPLPILAPEARSTCEATDPASYQVPAFAAINANGEAVTATDLNGNAYVVAFIDVQCTTPTCESTSMSLYRVQERFKDNNAVKIISYMVNPQADSLSVLESYLTKYKADESKWLALRSDEATTLHLGTCGYGLIKGSSLVHSPWIALVDGNSQIRGFYDTSIREEVDRLLIELKLLMTQQGVKR